MRRSLASIPLLVATGACVAAAAPARIPCTVAIRTADGRLLTDHPSFTDGFRSTGLFEKDVPRGRVTVTVSRGFDYGAREQQLDLREGEQRDLAFRIERRTPLHQLGWYAGDSHVHMIHGERTIVVDFAYVALAARAEGLDYLGLCQHWNLPRITPEDLEQACERVSTPDFHLRWGMEAPKNYWRGDAGRCLGHGWTSGMRGRTADGRDAVAELIAMDTWDYESDKPPVPNFEIQAFIHALGGMVSYTHPHRWWWGKWGGQGGYPVEERKAISNIAQELPFDTVAGPTYDTIDILMQPHEREVNRKAQETWFLLLNKGYRIAATASSDTTFDNPGGGVPGKVRVYGRVPGEPTAAAVAESMRTGRSFVTSGPLLLLDIAGREPGDSIRIGPAKQLRGRIRAWASGAPGERLTKVELFRNGQLLRTFEPNNAPEFTAEFEVPASEPAWVIARCYGSTPDQFAVTNPVYLENRPYRPPEPARARVVGSVRDRATGAALEGTVAVVHMDGRRPVRDSEVPFRGGRFELTAPATARIEVRVNGYRPQLESIFMDYAPLRDLTLNLKEQQLSDWGTYEEIRRLLEQVRLDVPLEPAR